MKGLRVDVCCPFDGADLDPVKIGDPDGSLSAMSARCTDCGSTFTVTAALVCSTPRFPFDALERYIVRSLEVPAHQGPSCPYCATAPDGRGGSGCASVPMIARMCGVGVDTVQSWKRRGLNERKADLVASSLGTHAGNIWPDQWDALCAGDIDELEDA